MVTNDQIYIYERKAKRRLVVVVVAKDRCRSGSISGQCDTITLASKFKIKQDPVSSIDHHYKPISHHLKRPTIACRVVVSDSTWLCIGDDGSEAADLPLSRDCLDGDSQQ
jgi:hypothetical protein